MQQIASQHSANGNVMEMIKAMRASQRGGSIFSQGGDNADPFLQIILNMIAAMEEGNVGNMAMLEGLEGFLPDGMEGMKDGLWADDQLGMVGSSRHDNEEDVDENLMLMQAAAMFFSPQGIQQMPELSQDQLSMLAEAVQGVDADRFSPKGMGQQLVTSMRQDVQQPVATERFVETSASQQTPVEVVDLPQQQKSQQGIEQVFSIQNQFRNAVTAAKQQMAQQVGTADQADEIDVDELQSKMSVFKASEGSRALSSQQLMETEDVENIDMANQIAKGINENIRMGKDEFVIKLRPEALGEITVKLAEKAGKMVLSITTASAQTARLINADLAALQDAVRPMQVEVHEAVPQVQEGQSGQFQAFDFSGQNPGQQAFQYQQEAPAYYVDVRPDGEEVEAAEQVLDAALDTYV